MTKYLSEFKISYSLHEDIQTLFKELYKNRGRFFLQNIKFLTA